MGLASYKLVYKSIIIKITFWGVFRYTLVLDKPNLSVNLNSIQCSYTALGHNYLKETCGASQGKNYPIHMYTYCIYIYICIHIYNVNMFVIIQYIDILYVYMCLSGRCHSSSTLRTAGWCPSSLDLATKQKELTNEMVICS